MSTSCGQQRVMEELKAGKRPRGCTGSGFHEATYLPTVPQDGQFWLCSVLGTLRSEKLKERCGKGRNWTPESDIQGTKNKSLLQTSVGRQHARTTEWKCQEGRFLPTTRKLFQGPTAAMER